MRIPKPMSLTVGLFLAAMVWAALGGQPAAEAKILFGKYVAEPYQAKLHYPSHYSWDNFLRENQDSTEDLWVVYANRDRAPMFARNGANNWTRLNNTAQWLQPFLVKGIAPYSREVVVNNRRTRIDSVFMRLESVGGRIPDVWMDVKHLIVFRHCIYEPVKDIRVKVFRKARLRLQGDTQGLWGILARTEPALLDPKKQSERAFFLEKPMDARALSVKWYYTYGVQLGHDPNAITDIKRYPGGKEGSITYYGGRRRSIVKPYDEMNYFLVGLEPTLDAPEFPVQKNWLNDTRLRRRVEESLWRKMKQQIKGWVPLPGAAAWSSRLALEEVPGRTLRWAHKIMEEGDFRWCYSRANRSEINTCVARLQHAEGGGRVVLDTGQDPPKKGGDLRYMVLRGSRRVMRDPRVRYARSGDPRIHYMMIGFQGKRDASGRIVEVARTNDQENKKLPPATQTQMGRRKVEIMVLIDATSSMEPVLQGTAQFARKFMEEVNLAKGAKQEIYFRAAIYRDQADQADGGDFKMSRGQSVGNVHAFLIAPEMRAKSHPNDKSYEEGLAYGIKRAVGKWKTYGFKDPESIRLMLIMGDAGNNRAWSQHTMQEAAAMLKQYNIRPLFVKFNHEFQADQPRFRNLTQAEREGKKRAEKWAMEQFRNDAKMVIAQLYSQLPKGELPIVEVGRPGQKLDPQEIERMVNQKVKQLMELARLYLKVVIDTATITSLGKSVEHRICADCYREPERSRCLQAADEAVKLKATQKAGQAAEPNNPWREFIKTHPSSILGAQILGMYEAELRRIQLQNPELFVEITTRPTLAFTEGFIAVRDGGERICRPVLLLSHSELQAWESDLAQFAMDNKNQCMDKNVKDIMTRYLNLIFGEINQIDPNNITTDQLRRVFNWLDLGSEETRWSVSSLINRFCRMPIRQWSRFIKQAKQVPETLRKIKTDLKDERMYQTLGRDKTSANYYWVYPDEIFPNTAR